ncbi:MAG: 4-(cytidine 5'-diphospho)-2-C-methyl-D-erythritol kinase [Elusimicrobiales bacterium]
MIKIAARAKLNLFLEVTGRRPDGYHDLATMFARIGLADVLTLRAAAPGITLAVEGGPALGKPGDNIVYKAAEKFFAAFKIAPAVEIKLKKNIPVGAGLGGGSSDGAAALLGLAKLYSLPRSAFSRLMKIAAAIGSDVPFFMLDEMMAEGRGRGEKLKPLKPAGRLPYIVLVYPGVPVYTKEVYGNLKLGPAPEIKARLKEFSGLCSLIKKGGFVPGRAGRLFNRLEVPVLPRHKAVREAKARLAALGADAALMSGSGACVFGLCRGRAKAAAIAAALGRIKGYRVFLTKFC